MFSWGGALHALPEQFSLPVGTLPVLTLWQQWVCGAEGYPPLRKVTPLCPIPSHKYGMPT